MFDAHCHLNLKQLRKDLPGVIERARRAGVSQMTLSAVDVPSSEENIRIAERYDGVYAAVGIHPEEDTRRHETYSVERARADIAQLAQLAAHPKVVAIGETGLSTYYLSQKISDAAIRAELFGIQRELFAKQIELAIAHGKALIIHSREAPEETISALTAVWNPKFEGRTVFHCCEPRDEFLAFAKERRVYIGVDGDVTYNRAKQKFISRVPLDLLVLETDAPFLLPEPLRAQKRYPNEPANLPVIAEYIANLRGTGREELARITAENGAKLYGIGL